MLSSSDDTIKPGFRESLANGNTVEKWSGPLPSKMSFSYTHFLSSYEDDMLPFCLKCIL
jgi:hypothetical protein